MYKVWKNNYLFVIFLLVLVLSQTGISSETRNERLISSELLKQANLKLVWEHLLPMLDKDKMERMLILDDHIYLISKNNFLLSLNRNNGDKIFFRSVSQEGLTTKGFNRCEDQVIYYVGNRYFEIDPKTGSEQKNTKVGYNIACPVVRNESFFYISGIDKFLHTYKAEDRIELFKVTSESPSMITSVIASEDCVIFGTEKGNVYSMLPDSPKSLWRFDAAGGIVDQLVRQDNSLYFSTDQMYVYKIDMPSIYTKNFVWKALLPGMVQKPPIVTDNMVYQVVFNKKMVIVAIDKDSGNIQWSLNGGVDLLAESRGKAYCLTQDKTLVVIENSTGEQLYSVNFTNVSKNAVNIIDGKIYIGDDSGKVMCLEPGR